MKSTQNKKLHFSKDDVKRKSSIIFMQLGLIFALLLTYIAIESKTLIKDTYVVDNFPIPTEEIEDDIPETTHEKEIPKEILQRTPEPVIDLVEPDIVEDDSDIIEDVIGTSEVDETTKVDVNYSTFEEDEYIPDEIPDKVPFLHIEEAPIFPGCTGTKKEIKACFSKSITKFVAKKFNGELAQELGLTPGKKRIFVQFTVNKDGIIDDIKVRAPHKRLEKEAKRVVNLLPQMIPGKQRLKPVGVKFTLPITFLVE